MQDRPMLIGVTGGIGSGKSTVCKIVEVLGHKVYYADDQAKMLLQTNPTLRKKAISLFGNEAFDGEKINRKLIAEAAFSTPALLDQLNRAIHPLVASQLQEWISKNANEKLLFNEAALLFETGSYKKMNKTILVTAPKETRIERVLLRDKHRTRKSVEDIIDKQMHDEEKTPLADFVIHNDGQKSLMEQVLSVYKKVG